MIQSLGVGLGASCIGTYQLLFNEQYDVKSHQFLTISILSIPPLLADLLSSPITSLIRSAAERWSTQYDKDILKYAWVIGLSIVVITFILTFFIKEDKSLVFKDNISKQQIKTKNEWIYFYMLAVLGFLIAFVKFSNSGSIAVTHVQELAKLLNYPSSGSYEGYIYISLLFSISQLAGGLITGMVLIKRFSKLFIFCLGSGIWIIYEILCLFVYNPYAYLGVHMLNGFAYGILYNLILGFVLMRCFKTNKITPMGIYQMILSIGITLSTRFEPWIKYVMHEEDADWMHYKSIIMVINGVVIGVIMLSVLIFYYCHCLENKIKIENKPKSVDINKKMIS